jgi:hypothetical protein
MSNEKKKPSVPQSDKGSKIEKGQRSELNYNKLPDFKFTPPTPPPTKTDKTSSSKE